MSITKPKKSVEIAEFAEEALFDKGLHRVRCIDCKDFPATLNDDGTTTAKKLVLTWRDVASKAEVTDTLTNGKVAYFMNSVNRQFNGEMCGWKLSEVIGFCMENDIDLTVEWSPSYGVQLIYNRVERPEIDPSAIKGAGTKRPTERKATK